MDTKMSLVKLNIGCGSVLPVGWINMDKSIKRYVIESRIWRFFCPAGSAEQIDFRYINLRHSWLFSSSSVDVVYSSHVFEHLDAATQIFFLREAARVLKPGGILRIVVPDLFQLCKEYVNSVSEGSEDAAGQLLYWLNLHKDNVYQENRSVLRKTYDFIQGHPHLLRTMFDRQSLLDKIDSDLFGDFCFNDYGESKYLGSLVREVEFAQEICSSLYLECRKR